MDDWSYNESLSGADLAWKQTWNVKIYFNYGIDDWPRRVRMYKNKKKKKKGIVKLFRSHWAIHPPQLWKGEMSNKGARKGERVAWDVERQI